MLTPKQLQARSPYAIFWAASRDGQRFVAVKGSGLGQRSDWALYADKEELPASAVVANGKKVVDPNMIRELTACSEELLELYRF